MWKKALACLLTLLALCAGAAAEDTLTLPEKLQIIEEEAFLNATGLKHVSVPEGTLEIGARAFAGSSVRSIAIPASVKAIAEDAFQGVSGLEVTGQEGSYAQEYCEKHSISFTPVGAEPQPYPESAHPYPDNADQTWTWTGRADTKLLRIQFNQAMVEHGCDWLYVYDGEGNLLRRYTGSLPSGCRMLIPGHSFSIRLVSDEGSNAYGFSIRNIEELTSFTETPLKITSVSAPASPSVASFSNANTWTVEAEGSFTPLSYQYRLMRADASGEKEYTCSEHFRTFQTEYLWEAGLYTMYVTVTDGLGRSVTQKTDPIVVQYAEPLSIASLTADVESAWAGETVCWQAAYENAVYPMTVEYVVSRDGAEVKRETKVIGSGQNEAKYSYVPAASGSHTLTVTATDAAGFTASYTSAALPVQGTADPAVTITADCETVIVATPITWTVAAENDNSPRVYYYSVHQNGTRVFAGSQSTADGRMTVTWTPDAACDWTLDISFYVGDTSVQMTSDVVRVINDPGTAHGDFYYKLNSAGEALISGYSGTDGYVIIPETIAGVPVVGIADQAFAPTYNNDYASNSVITEVIIPDSVQTIGQYAFYQCPNLHTVDFGEGVTTVGSYAFYGCPSLRKIVYPRSLSASQKFSLFENCTSLKTVVVPEGVTTLPQSVFRNATALESVTLPSSLTKVMNYAFYGCTSLKAIELPDSVTSIGSGAFRDCASLTSFRYPKGWATKQATSTNIFAGCTKLERVTIPEGATRVVRHAFRGCEGLREVQCPTTLESIDSYAFADCLNLTTVVLPEGLKTVESSAFSGCVSLKVIDLPNSVETIEGVAFGDCTSLETVHLPTQWKTAGYNIFSNCTKLKTVVVPQGLTKLPDDAFVGCSSIEEVYLPSSLLEIGEYAFSGCTGLKDVHFQEGLRKINACAFRGCTSLKDADLPDSVEHILDCIFENCTSLETFRYPLNWYNTFVSSSWPYHIYSGYHVRGCTKLTKIIVPEGVTTLPHFIMCGCDNIEEVVLPDSLLEIQDGAFSDCANLRKANIPGSVVYIGKDVFANCPLLNISCEWETKGYHYAADNNFAHEYLTLHSAEYPRGKLPMGEAFAFGGELHASEQIHSLSAHVYNADGSRLLQGSIATPYDTAADLGDCFTSAFHIEDLPEGRYLFRMKAVVNGSAEKVLAETIFDIVSSGGDCETDGLVLPEGTLRQGYAFPFGGKVILDLEGGTLSGSLSIAIVEEIENQNVRSCILAPDLLGEIDLKNAQENLAFATLEPGIYTCRLTATLGYDRFLVTQTHFRISPENEDTQRAQKLDAALLGLSSSRSSDLLYESAILSNRAYDVNQAISNLEALGFRNVMPYSISPGAHTIGHFLAWKDILFSDGSVTRAYAVICRGTAPYLNEWMSNFTLASPDGYHHGFYQAAQEVRRNFQAYVAEHAPDEWAPRNYKVWITGHSRGAAVANMLGGAFLVNDGYTRSNVFTYTFACPFVYKGSAPSVNNVFNFNIGGDLVPCVPLENWGYSRYGSTVTLPNGDQAFGLKLTHKNDAATIVELLSRVDSVDRLEQKFNEAMKDLDLPSVDEVFRRYLITLFELLVEMNQTSETDNLAELLLLLKDVGTTHASTTYIEWIASLTGK